MLQYYIVLHITAHIMLNKTGAVDSAQIFFCRDLNQRLFGLWANAVLLCNTGHC